MPSAPDAMTARSSYMGALLTGGCALGRLATSPPSVPAPAPSSPPPPMPPPLASEYAPSGTGTAPPAVTTRGPQRQTRERRGRAARPAARGEPKRTCRRRREFPPRRADPRAAVGQLLVEFQRSVVVVDRQRVLLHQVVARRARVQGLDVQRVELQHPREVPDRRLGIVEFLENCASEREGQGLGIRRRAAWGWGSRGRACAASRLWK